MSPTVERYASGAADADRLAAALARVAHLPYTRAYGLPPDGAIAWFAQQFEAAAPATAALVARAQDDIVGGIVLSRRPWESEIYGVPMGRIAFGFTVGDDRRAGVQAIGAALVAAARDVLAEWRVRHCSALVPAEELGLIHALGDDRWRLVDSTLEMAWECGRTVAPEPDPRYVVRASTASDREALAELARQAYTHSIRTRYSADPRLPREQTGELYAGWVRQAVDGHFADVVVVAEVEGRPIAFNTFKLETALSRALGIGFAAHGISAVDPAHRGLRMQPAMLHWLAEWQARRGGRFNYGRVLINNYVMQRACLRAGAFNAQAYHTFHGWFDGPEGAAAASAESRVAELATP
jgi:GNAT superfamily N-acetyltransferase